MDFNNLNAISPIDGRYRRHTENIEKYFSEAALIRYRILVEVEYFIALCELPLPELKNVDSSIYPQLRALYTDFKNSDAQRVKDIEKITNHDVKAVEYFIKEKIDSWGLGNSTEFIHFGLTSQDINNTSIPLSLKHAVEEVIIPELEITIQQLNQLSDD